MPEGYYIIKLESADKWPYIQTVIVGGPYTERPAVPQAEEQKVRYWAGDSWHSTPPSAASPGIRQ